MTAKNFSEPAPARIHLLAAKDAPYVVVIRRKPSRLVHILRWNTQTDEIEHGSWFNGRIYEMRSDVSFDGQYMIYLAMGSIGTTWVGVCRPPFLRTEVDWPNAGSWHGGGLFRSPDSLELNAGHAETGARKAIKETKARFPFAFGTLVNSGYGEDEGVLYARFERDGFRRIGPFGKKKVLKNRGYTVICEDDPGWSMRPTPSHPELRVRYRGYFDDRGRVFEWDLPDHPELLDEHVSWATYDALGQLIVARLGILYRYSLEDLLAHSPSAVFDLEPLQRPARTEGTELEEDDGTPLPPIEIVKGTPLQDLDVRTLIVPAGGRTLITPASETSWIRHLQDLAGKFLDMHLHEWSPEPGDVLRTPAYYLRQHDLVHVAEPPPSAGIESLRQACFAAFEAASMGSDSSIALKPIGLDAGWPMEEALAATMEAATRYVENEPTRRVLIVED